MTPSLNDLANTNLHTPFEFASLNTEHEAFGVKTAEESSKALATALAKIRGLDLQVRARRRPPTQ